MWLSRVTSVAVLAVAATLSIVGVANAQDDRNCSDFKTQAEAQAHFNKHSGDPDRLDSDNDGIACEHLPGPSSTATPLPADSDEHRGVHPAPVGPVDTGDGSIVDASTADDSGALALLLGLVGLGAAATTAVVVTRRARRTS